MDSTRLLGVRLFLLVDGLITGAFLFMVLHLRLRLPAWPDHRFPGPVDPALPLAGCGAVLLSALAWRSGRPLLAFLGASAAVVLFATAGAAANGAGWTFTRGRYGFALHGVLGILALHALVATGLLASRLLRGRPATGAAGTGALLHFTAALALAAAGVIFLW